MNSPLIIKAPGVQGGQTVEAVIGNVDIYPTLLELAGVEKPAGVHFHGKSLAPLLKDPKADWDNITYTCAKQRYGLITDRYRFTVSDIGHSLFDLKKDPHEWENLGNQPEYANLVNEFKMKLAEVVWNSPTGESMETGEPKLVADPKKKNAATKWDWFGALDANKDGTVTEEEWLKRSKTTAKKKGKAYDENKQKDFFAGHDKNADGLISREELESR